MRFEASRIAGRGVRIRRGFVRIRRGFVRLPDARLIDDLIMAPPLDSARGGSAQRIA